jgi:hypothetical protein
MLGWALATAGLVLLTAGIGVHIVAARELGLLRAVGTTRGQLRSYHLSWAILS